MPFCISTGASRVPSERVTWRARIAIVSVSAGACMKMGQSLVSRTWVYGAPLLLVQLIIGCSPSAPEQNSGRAEANVAVLAETSAVAEDKKLVVAFGDSLFAGYNLAHDQGFAPALARSLSAQGLAFREYGSPS